MGMNIKIVGQYSLAWGATADAALRDLFMTAGLTSDCDIHVDRSEDRVEITLPREGIEDQELTYVLAKGFVASSEPVWIRMSAATYADEVPAGLPQRDIVDDEGVVTGVRTWEQWRNKTHHHTVLQSPEANGDVIVPGNSWGSRLTLEEIEPLRIDPSYTLLSASDMRVIQAAEPQEKV